MESDSQGIVRRMEFALTAAYTGPKIVYQFRSDQEQEKFMFMWMNVESPSGTPNRLHECETMLKEFDVQYSVTKTECRKSGERYNKRTIFTDVVINAEVPYSKAMEIYQSACDAARRLVDSHKNEQISRNDENYNKFINNPVLSGMAKAVADRILDNKQYSGKFYEIHVTLEMVQISEDKSATGFGGYDNNSTNDVVMLSFGQYKMRNLMNKEEQLAFCRAMTVQLLSELQSRLYNLAVFPCYYGGIQSGSLSTSVIGIAGNQMGFPPQNQMNDW